MVKIVNYNQSINTGVNSCSNEKNMIEIKKQKINLLLDVRREKPN